LTVRNNICTRQSVLPCVTRGQRASYHKQAYRLAADLWRLLFATLLAICRQCEFAIYTCGLKWFGEQMVPIALCQASYHCKSYLVANAGWDSQAHQEYCKSRMTNAPRDKGLHRAGLPPVVQQWMFLRLVCLMHQQQ